MPSNPGTSRTIVKMSPDPLTFFEEDFEEAGVLLETPEMIVRRYRWGSGLST